MPVDILAFGPHPDDAEIGCGGLLLKLKEKGRRTGIIDMTSGDMGWGTPEGRGEESAEAARLLQLDVRENLYFHGRFFGMSAKESRREADRLLEVFRLTERASAPVLALSPRDGNVERVYAALKDKPEVVNVDPLASWMIVIELSRPDETAGLLDSSQYESLIK